MRTGAGVLLALVLALAAVNLDGLARVGIGGEVYARIADASGLEVAIAPPPPYLAEANGEALRLSSLTQHSEVAGSVERLRGHKAAFDEQQRVWVEAELPDHLRAGVAAPGRGSAAGFGGEVEGSLVPLVEARAAHAVLSPERTTAIGGATARISEVFAAHHAEAEAILGDILDARADEAAEAEAPARWARAEAPRKLRASASATRPAAQDGGWQEV